MRWSNSVLFVSLVALGCNGTSTGNPMGGGAGSGGSGSVPPGVELLMSDVAHDTNPVVSTDEAATLGSSNRSFAFDLYGQFASEPGNVFVSPFSISVALAMTYPGTEGMTETEIASALHFDLPEPALHSAFNATLIDLARRPEQLDPEATGSDGFQLSIVNQAWGQNGYSFRDSYLDVLAQHYGAGLFGVNFAESETTRQIINGWVAEQTKDRVKDLLPEDALNDLTRLVLTNAIYFKGNWLHPFHPAQTRDGVFHAAAGDRTVPVMHGEIDLAYAAGANYQALELPYVSPAVRMLLILPAEGQFDAVSAGLNEAFFQELRGAFGVNKILLGLPKFQFEFKSPLEGPLTALGMPSAFIDGVADFSGLTDSGDTLFIDEVYHQTFVAIDEVGTEAAAATAVVIGDESAPMPLTFDRPFIFMIYDEPTGQILFLGRLVDPG